MDILLKKTLNGDALNKIKAEALCNNGHQVVVLSVDSRFLWKFRKVGITHYSKNGVNYYNSFWFPGVLTRTISRKFNVFIKK